LRRVRLPFTRGLEAEFADRRRVSYLRDVVKDPDSLWEKDVPVGLREELEARDLVVYDL